RCGCAARRRTCACGYRRSLSSGVWAVELRREESRRGLQDRVGPPQLSHLTLQLSKALGLVGAGTGAISGVDLGLDHPVAQGLAVDAQLIAHTCDGTAAAGRVPAGVHGHAGSAFTQLIGVFPRDRKSTRLNSSHVAIPYAV